MLWRPTYETRILRAASLPPLTGFTLDHQDGSTPVEGPVIGAFAPLASAELGIWRRLLQEAFPERSVPTVLIRPAWTERDRRTIADGTPPALHSITLLANDPGETWSNEIHPDRPERSFGLIMSAGIPKLLMVGLPTEDAWDEFRILAGGLAE